MVKLWNDEGHGGHDPGAFAFNLAEKDVTLNLGNRIDQILANQAEGVQVSSTRDEDVFVGLSTRANWANDWGADYFNAYHVDSGGGNRYTIYIHTNASDTTASIAENLFNEIYPFFNQHGIGRGGVRRANFAVLRQTNMHAFLHENGFIDHRPTNDLLKQMDDGGFLDQLSWVYARAFAKVFGFTLNEKKVDKLFEPGSPTLRQAVEYVLYRMELEGDLTSQWRQKLLAGMLTESEAIGLLYVAVERGFIHNKYSNNIPEGPSN